VTSPLENLSGPGQSLRKEAPDAKEFAGLKQSGLTRLADAEKQANSLASRFVRLIEYQDAPPEVRAVYDDIMATAAPTE
jgi:hypothetical protein